MGTPLERRTEVPPRAAIPCVKRRAGAWRAGVEGFVLGALGWLASLRLGLPDLVVEGQPLVLHAGLAGAALGFLGLRRLLWAASLGLVLLLGVVAYTPLSRPLVRSLVVRETPRPSDAVVVLSASTMGDKLLSGVAQDRLLRGLELVRQGYAPLLVTTWMPEPPARATGAVREQIRALRLDVPLEAVGPTSNTHDEALGVARLARARGWRQVILVTSPSHTRRAVGAFRRAGLRVLSCPSVERRYNLSSVASPGDRLRAFEDWLHEAVGWQVYRWRGWL